MNTPLVPLHPLDPVLWLSVLAAYALGCVNAGYYIVRWKTGRDLRELGSGNAGATNVGRVLGPTGFGVTLLLDMLKGALAVYGAQFAGLPAPAQVLVVAAAIVGHNWPAPLGFRGGKGVATSCGALMFFDPFLTLATIGVCAALLAVTRRPTVSAVCAYGLMPMISALLGYDALVIVLLLPVAALVISPHGADLAEELAVPTLSPASAPNPPPAPPAIATPAPSLRFKLATEPWEFEAIHRLNHRTFVEEIPQHAPRPDRRLVDRFHAENEYIVALHGRDLVGMLALRGRRPFSLDAKVPGLDRFLPAGRRAVEGRLLAVEPAFRQTAVFTALFAHAVRHCREAGYDLAVISATTRQLKLYRHLGFTPFGPLVGTAAASYQPMFLTLEHFGRTAENSPALRSRLPDLAAPRRPLNLLPGPVLTTPEVDAALAAPALSHRGPAFLALMDDVRTRLCSLTGARHVQVLPGSGSLANAVVAAQLSLGDAPGLVLANGEFGERLAAEARRARLRCETLRLPWGVAFDLAEVERRAAGLPRGSWLWFVHHETSTGMGNPLAALTTLAARHGLRLCVDCISSLGAQPVDLRGVHLATGTSGKGLGAYPGLSLVFHDYEPHDAPDRLPGYLDLGHWAAHGSVPHTHSSNLVGALAVALRAVTPARLTRIRENATWLRAALHAQGFTLVVPDAVASPGVVTIALEPDAPVRSLGEALERRGFVVNHLSPHLRARHWLQFALLGDPPREGLERLVDTLRQVRAHASPPSPPVDRDRTDARPELTSV
ncbi:MAG: glycerol-3-phosphate acyltransferase [Verrucomicrobia bacterium]|nr:glycerol-3-phosphate acyltransferase [Verrucomicrobiota bacterium]